MFVEFNTVEIDDNDIEKSTIGSFEILENNSDSDQFIKEEIEIEEKALIDESSMIAETFVEEIHLQNEDVEIQANSDNAEEDTSIVSEYLESAEKTEAYICIFCSKQFATKGQVQSHERRIHIKKENMMYKCDDCEESFNSRQLLKEHNSKAHTPKLTFTCDMCDKIFYSRYSLKNHRNHFHDLVPKQHQCEICCKYCNRDS